MSNEPTPLACNMLAIPAAERSEHASNWQRLRAQVVGVQALPDGYAFQFEPDEGTLALIAQVIARERLCCPFLRLAITIEPDRGPMWLALTGREGVKRFVETEFASVLAR